MSLFWIGDKEPPSSGGLQVPALAYRHIVNSLDKNPAATSGGIPASVAAGKLRKYDFPPELVSAAANVLKLTRSGRGSMLRWKA